MSQFKLMPMLIQYGPFAFLAWLTRSPVIHQWTMFVDGQHFASATHPPSWLKFLGEK